MERTSPVIALSHPLPEHLWHIVHLDFNIVNTGAGRHQVRVVDVRFTRGAGCPGDASGVSRFLMHCDLLWNALF